MKIGLDARPLAVFSAGIGNYVRNILENWPAEGDEFFLYSHRPLSAGPAASDYNTIIKKDRGPSEQGEQGEQRGGNRFHFRTGRGGWGTPWMLWRAPAEIRKDAPQVYWGTTHLLPDLEVPAVLTVYDLTVYEMPETMAWRNRWIHRFFFSRSLARADRIVCVSRATAEALRARFPESAQRIQVIPLASCVRPPAKTDPAILRRMGLPDRFILTVGTDEPRKNRRIAAETIAELHRRGHRIAWVIAGSEGWGDTPWKDVIQKNGLDSWVFPMGRVCDETLAQLYAQATVFFFPSLYEGFGLPPLEAMACGCPVVAGKYACAQEVLDKAALLADPRDIRALADALESLLTDDSRRRDLIKRGRRRAGELSWAESARRMRDLFREVAEERKK